jgi:hypothetical protein
MEDLIEKGEQLIAQMSAFWERSNELKEVSDSLPPFDAYTEAYYAFLEALKAAKNA